MLMSGGGVPRNDSESKRNTVAVRCRLAILLSFLTFAACFCAQVKPMQWQLIIADPGHFHASLLQREMYPMLAQRVAVYATLGPDVLDYLNRVSLFNSRRESPTRWELDVHLSANPIGEMLRREPGNIVV